MRHRCRKAQRKLPRVGAGAELVLALALGSAARAAASRGKLLLVVAHPDDEYAFAATVYRLAREQGWVVDQMVVTNGEGGHRYSALAEAHYGVRLAGETGCRERLVEIRRQEVERAGKILGIRRFHFLGQRDLGFDQDVALAGTENWDRVSMDRYLGGLLARERYDAVFTLLPTATTHGHHRVVAEWARAVVRGLPEAERPVVLGAEPRAEGAGRIWPTEPVLAFDRRQPFGLGDSLSYQVPVNWVIAEHKSQGLFQMDSGRHQWEEYWLLDGDRTQLEPLARQLLRG